MKSVEHIKKRIVELDELIESHHQHIKDAEIAKQTYLDSINIIHDEENSDNKTEKTFQTPNVPLIENPKRKYKARKAGGFREGSQPYKAEKVLLKSGKPMGIPELAKLCDVSRENYRAFGSGLADKSRAGNVFIKMDRGVYGLIELLGTYG